MNRRNLAIGLVAVVAFLALLLFGHPHHRSGLLTMTAIDVGQGDSIFIETPSGRTILIDGGGHSDSMTSGGTSDVGESVVVPFLRHEGVTKLDLVVVTHPHGDHVGGLTAVLHDFKVGKVLDGTVLPFPTPAYLSLEQAERDAGVTPIHASRGMRIDMRDGVILDVLNPPVSGYPYGTEPTNDAMNNYSVVLRMKYRNVTFMLDGDAEADAEANMLAAYPYSLGANVLKCGHHGSRNASSDDWLSAVSPRFGIISCGLHNHYGHPNIETLDRLDAHNVRVLRTDQMGAVTLTSDGTSVEARTER